MGSGDWGVWSEKCGVGGGECGVRRVEWGMGVWSEKSGVGNGECGVGSVE